MMRSLLAAALVFQTTVGGAQLQGIDVTGAFDSSLRQFLVSAPTERVPGNAIVSEMRAHLARQQGLEAVAAARRLLSAPPDQLATGIRAIRDDFFQLPDDGTALRPAVLALVTDLKTHIATLSKADGAAAAREMMWLEYSLDRANVAAHERRMADFLSRYEGTPAAIHHIIDRVPEEHRYDANLMRPRSLELAKQHGGTEYGAHALYALAFRLSADAITRPLQPDPTARFIEVLSIVDELEGGAFPKCEWVDNAAKLVTEFRVFEPQYAPENVSRNYDGYLRFVVSHIGKPMNGASMAFMLQSNVALLAAKQTDALPLIDRFIDDLVKAGVAVDHARRLHADVYIGILRDNSMQHFPITPEKAAAAAIKSLVMLEQSAAPSVRAQALADLASIDFFMGRYSDARRRYLDFVNRYPSSDSAWVAAFRAAEAVEAQGDLPRAAAEYEQLAGRSRSRRAAAVAALIAAADVREALAQFIDAAADYKTALAMWDEMPDRLMVYTGQLAGVTTVPKPLRLHDLTRADVRAKLDRLSGTVSVEGALLYQGSRALEEGKPDAAFAPLRRLIEQFPRSQEARDAVAVLRRARFEKTLSDTRSDSSARERELASLALGATDDISHAAQLAHAALLLLRGADAQAEAMTRAALDHWQRAQPASVVEPSPVLRDASAIRTALLTETGRRVLGNGWNAFTWPSTPLPFFLANGDVVIKTPDGKELKMLVPLTLNGEARLILLTAMDFRNLQAILERIGGTETREPSSIMDTPNQPIGGAPKIAALWSKFFHVRPGHWGGWELATYPYVGKITFDSDRHALAEFVIGYSGGTLELIKDNDVWIPKRIVSSWIE